jgi:hypothetical protein
MKTLKKLFLASGIIVGGLMSSFSAFADNYMRTDAASGSEWMVDFPAVLKAYHIEVQDKSGHHSNYYWVSGYQLCPGVFLFQSVVNGDRKDLIFENEDLAKKFKAKVELQRFGGDNIYLGDTVSGKVGAVGYKTEDNKIRMLYLKQKDLTAENYACPDSKLPQYKEGMWLYKETDKSSSPFGL